MSVEWEMFPWYFDTWSRFGPGLETVLPLLVSDSFYLLSVFGCLDVLCSLCATVCIKMCHVAHTATKNDFIRMLVWAM